MRQPRLMFVAIATLVMLALPGIARADDTNLHPWSTYEKDLYQALVDPEKRKALEATIVKIVAAADEAGRKPPPGVLAEYGYLLLQRGERDSAVEAFEREAREWPDAEVLMKRMIERARKGPAS